MRACRYAWRDAQTDLELSWKDMRFGHRYEETVGKYVTGSFVKPFYFIPNFFVDLIKDKPVYERNLDK